MATSYLETTLYRKCIVKLNRGEIECIQVVGRSLMFKVYTLFFLTMKKERSVIFDIEIGKLSSFFVFFVFFIIIINIIIIIIIIIIIFFN